MNLKSIYSQRVTGSVTTIPSGVQTVTDEIAAAAALGQVKTYGTGMLTAVAAGNVRITVANETADHMLTLVGLYVSSTVAGMGAVRLNPTIGLPTALRPVGINAVIGGGLAGVTTVKADTSATIALDGGTNTGIVLGTGANRPGMIELPAPVMFAPGSPVMGLGVNLGAAFTFAAWLTFIEKPL